MDTINSVEASSSNFLKVTPNQLRELANNLEKQAQLNQYNGRIATIKINEKMTLMYVPTALDRKETYASRQESTFRNNEKEDMKEAFKENKN